MNLERYIVRPSPLGGYELSGPRLPFGIRYVVETHAMDYGHHMLRGHAGSVVALDSRGNVIVSERGEAADAKRDAPCS